MLKTPNTDEYVNELLDMDIFGKPKDVKIINNLNLQDRFSDKSITTLDYKEDFKGKYIDDNGKKISVPMLKSVKVSGLSPTMQLSYYNDSLLKMDKETQQSIIDNLDYRSYLEMVENNFELWYNPEVPPAIIND